jgi:hypothetical protein
VTTVHKAPADYPSGKAGDVNSGVHRPRQSLSRTQRRPGVPAQRGVLLPDRHG